MVYMLEWSTKEAIRCGVVTDDDYFYFRPKKIKHAEYNGVVYNLEVEDDNSYDVGFSVHNCAWYVNSSEYNYCFFNLAKELKNNPLSDKEICTLLMINQKTLNEVTESALGKLRALKGTEVMDEFMEAIGDSIKMQNPDHTVYLPDSFVSKIEEDVKKEEEKDEEEKDKEPKSKRGRKVKGYGMPVHRSGKRVDLYGIYSKTKLEEIKKNGKKDNKN